ncbi:MAG: sulfotransferase [Rhodospirillales bacterium]|nr:sulfotransferase [Rhodospirillales bacterium]
MAARAFVACGLADRMLLLLGAPRSGTTWVGKVFDSHPDVLYRHEPDTVVRGGALPKVMAVREIPNWTAEARAYLLRLAALSPLRASGHLPLFAKSYRGAAAQRTHSGAIYLLRLLSALPRVGTRLQSLPVPDLAARPPRLVVIKSVISCGCAGLYAAALPEARIIFLVRPPFGQVASMLHGTKLGKVNGVRAVVGLGDWPVAARYGLSETDLARLPLVERLAWMWVLQNEAALTGLADRPGVRVMPYRALRDDPAGASRALFDFAGLDWSPRTEEFVARSTRAGLYEGYFGVYRNTTAPEKKWRTLLSAADRRRIVAIVRQSTLTDFLDPEADAAAE